MLHQSTTNLIKCFVRKRYPHYKPKEVHHTAIELYGKWENEGFFSTLDDQSMKAWIEVCIEKKEGKRKLKLPNFIEQMTCTIQQLKYYKLDGISIHFKYAKDIRLPYIEDLKIIIDPLVKDLVERLKRVRFNLLEKRSKSKLN